MKGSSKGSKIDFIESFDYLWFSYGNSIDECFKDKDYKKAKELFDKFYMRYEELKHYVFEAMDLKNKGV